MGRLGLGLALGSGIEVSASFQKNKSLPRESVRVTGLGPRVVGRLGSGVWVIASFKIFSL